MKIGMTYKDIIKNSPKGDEKMMWDAVDRVDCLISKLRKEQPEMARDFLVGEYEAMNGKHINEWLAKEMVAKMWHKDKAGANIVTRGELVPLSAAVSLLAGMTKEEQEKCKWDAYVGANAMMHDLGDSVLSKDEIMDAAKYFWFHDDDMGDDIHKVYWYFKDWIFE